LVLSTEIYEYLKEAKYFVRPSKNFVI
jgi:hypothetical protein